MNTIWLNDHRKIFAGIVLGWICLFAAVAVADPVVIGIPHSEAYPYADMMKNSFEMAAERINADGGIKGRPVKLVYANDQGKKELRFCTTSTFPKAATISRHNKPHTASCFVTNLIRDWLMRFALQPMATMP